MIGSVLLTFLKALFVLAFFGVSIYASFRLRYEYEMKYIYLEGKGWGFSKLLNALLWVLPGIYAISMGVFSHLFFKEVEGPVVLAILQGSISYFFCWIASALRAKTKNSV
jgi:hypothetical protein